MPGFDLPWGANQYPSADGASGLARGWSFPRHCEEPTGPAFGGPDDKFRDEAIHIALRGAMDCFAALAMTNQATTVRFGSTISNMRGNSSISAISSSRLLALSVNFILPLLTPSGNDVCLA